MSDPVLSFILVLSFFAALTAASWFRTLDAALWSEARVPLVAGAIAGGILYFVPNVVAIGVILTLAALYVRLTGRESEPTDGMILGAMTGGAAAVPLVILDADRALLHLSSCILAGAVAGYGITFGLTHVRAKLRQLAIDAITAAVAIGAAALPAILVRTRIAEREVAIAASAFVPVLVIATVFKQWPAIRGELRHEAALGVIDDEDVRPTAHPLRRLGRAGWHDAGAHREFVRIANKIALRKRQQRGRSEEVARLYQVEVIKLRMELQEMTRIDRAMREAGMELKIEN
ncbi:MAG TPA: hypothetical protein VGQ36_17145 [Thermoanaerobaculia bacterium]|jgi:hypothetical protein|nr:hypothetical protein [Thermoanaerobaculia bacterium]